MTDTAPPKIQLTDVHKSFGPKVVLDGVDQLAGTRRLVALEVADDAPGRVDAQPLGQGQESSRVLGGDEVGGGERVAQARARVVGRADGRRGAAGQVQPFGVDQPIGMAQFATQPDGERLARLAVPGSASFHRARHPHVVAAVGHLGDLHPQALQQAVALALSVGRPLQPILPANLDEYLAAYGKPLDAASQWRVEGLSRELQIRLAPALMAQRWLEQEAFILAPAWQP